MNFHPASEIFPLMNPQAFEELKADIKEHGLIEPIITYKGKILDGRNRYKACVELGVTPKYWEWREDTDPVDYVISLNLHRRHLNESQRSMVAASIANMRQGSRTDKPSANLPEVSQSQAADKLNVSERSLRSAKKVKDKGIPALKTAVEQGAISVSEASKIAEKPQEEQKRAVKLPTASEARKQAKETGKAVLGRDGKYHSGRSLQEEQEASKKVDQHYALVQALREINKLSREGITLKDI